MLSIAFTSWAASAIESKRLLDGTTSFPAAIASSVDVVFSSDPGCRSQRRRSPGFQDAAMSSTFLSAEHRRSRRPGQARLVDVTDGRSSRTPATSSMRHRAARSATVPMTPDADSVSSHPETAALAIRVPASPDAVRRRVRQLANDLCAYLEGQLLSFPAAEPIADSFRTIISRQTADHAGHLLTQHEQPARWAHLVQIANRRAAQAFFCFISLFSLHRARRAGVFLFAVLIETKVRRIASSTPGAALA